MCQRKQVSGLMDQNLDTAPQQQFLISAAARFAIKDRIIARKGEHANAIPQ
jgi:hypothetical protein